MSSVIRERFEFRSDDFYGFYDVNDFSDLTKPYEL